MAIALKSRLQINWRCRHTWKKSSYNTMWCLIGCAIGDFGTIAYFQHWGPDWSVFAIMSLAMLNGILTSIALETMEVSIPLSIANDIIVKTDQSGPQC